MSEADVQPARRPRSLPEGWMSPVDRKLSNLPEGKYFKLSVVAERLGVSEKTMRRLLKVDELTAPSAEMRMGEGPAVYLYTEEDIAEIAAYLKEH